MSNKMVVKVKYPLVERRKMINWKTSMYMPLNPVELVLMKACTDKLIEAMERMPSVFEEMAEAMVFAAQAGEALRKVLVKVLKPVRKLRVIKHE